MAWRRVDQLGELGGHVIIAGYGRVGQMVGQMLAEQGSQQLLDEVETVRPTQTGASVSPEGLAKILSGVSSSTTGIESTYGLELAFYVPPLGSKDKIRLLGYTQGLISARGL